MKFLLDTHILLWWIFNDSRLSKKSKRFLSQEDSQWVLSMVSLWEVVIKVSLGKLRLGMDFPNFVTKFIEGSKLELLPLKFSHLTRYISLPFHHRDPFDRMLIAQCQTEEIPLLTQDESFQAYRLPKFK